MLKFYVLSICYICITAAQTLALIFLWGLNKKKLAPADDDSTAEALARLRVVFGTLDSTGAGRLTKQQLQQGLLSLSAQQGGRPLQPASSALATGYIKASQRQLRGQIMSFEFLFILLYAALMFSRATLY